jgi:hypothetical protein
MEAAELSAPELAAKWKKSLALAHAAAQGTISFNLLSKAKQRWCPKDAFNDEISEKSSKLSLSLSSEGFRSLQEEKIIQYDAEQHRLLERMTEVISNVEPKISESGLAKIHFAFDPHFVPGKSLKQHKAKLNGDAFLSPAGQAFRDEYLRFICEVIAPHIRQHMPDETRIVFQVGARSSLEKKTLLASLLTVSHTRRSLPLTHIPSLHPPAPSPGVPLPADRAAVAQPHRPSPLRQVQGRLERGWLWGGDGGDASLETPRSHTRRERDVRPRPSTSPPRPLHVPLHVPSTDRFVAGVMDA